MRGNVIRLGAVALSIGACGQLLGVNDYTVTAAPDGDSTSRCAGFGNAEPCGGCVRDYCCAEAAACEGDEQCKKLATCAGACPLDDSECRAHCFSGVPKTVALRHYQACVLEKCSSDCLRCGDIGAAFGAECALCQSDPNKGCPEATACLGNDACRGFLACTVDRCPTWDTDPACRVSCAAENPDARDLFLAWAVSPVGACDTACRWGSHWDCSDFSSPNGKGTGQTQVRLHLDGFPDPVTIRHCLNSGECVGSPVIGDAGVATFVLPQVGIVDPAYFEITSAAGRTQLAYPSRRWIGQRADMHVLGNWTLLNQPVASDSGTVVVVMGDCIGSLETRTPNGSGATLRIDGHAEGIYFGPGGWSPSRGSGAMAEFDGVAPGLRTVRGFDPTGRPVSEFRVWVRNGALTWVNFNFPVTEQ